jgi:hypothetical protein
MALIDVLEKVSQKIENIQQIKFIGEYAEKDKVKQMLPEEHYAVLLETIDDRPYKDVPDWFETSIIIMSICRDSENGKNGSKWLDKEIIKLLNEEDLTDTEIKTRFVKWENSSEVVFDKEIQGWTRIAAYTIRWRLL